MYFDWTMILLLPALILAGYAQTKVTSTYSKYAKVMARSNITAAQMARQLLDMNGKPKYRAKSRKFLREYLLEHIPPEVLKKQMTGKSFLMNTSMRYKMSQGMI